MALFVDGHPLPRREDLVGPGKPASIAVVSKPEMTPREAALFFQELFAELHTHCKESIPPGMVRFCYAKANRRAPGKAELWA